MRPPQRGGNVAAPFVRRRRFRSVTCRAVAVAGMCLAGSAQACVSDTTSVEPPDLVRYRVEVSGETFVVAVQRPEQVDAMDARLSAGTTGVINGALLAGDGGFNAPWSWHLDPASVEVPDLAIEVCDGRPSMVENDLDYWLGTVKRFCPWGARVVERLDG